VRQEFSDWDIVLSGGVCVGSLVVFDVHKCLSTMD